MSQPVVLGRRLNRFGSVCVFRLMAYSLGLAGRGVRHRGSAEVFASLSHDEHGAGTANIHAGSALLATGGICLLGDLGCYKKDKMDAIQSGTAPRCFIDGPVCVAQWVELPR